MFIYYLYAPISAKSYRGQPPLEQNWNQVHAWGNPLLADSCVAYRREMFGHGTTTIIYRLLFMWWVEVWRTMLLQTCDHNIPSDRLTVSASEDGHSTVNLCVYSRWRLGGIIVICSTYFLSFEMISSSSCCLEVVIIVHDYLQRAGYVPEIATTCLTVIRYLGRDVRWLSSMPPGESGIPLQTPPRHRGYT